jgi:hypothetical protein
VNADLSVATACPLRGRLGETEYIRLHPSGERAIEAVLLIPPGAGINPSFGRYFRLFGRWPAGAGTLSVAVLAQLVSPLRAGVPGREVLFDDAMLMSRESIMAALDSGALVARQSASSSPYLLRSSYVQAMPA